FPDKNQSGKRNPMQKKTITKLLALPNFEVVKVLAHYADSLHLYIDLVQKEIPRLCRGTLKV
ncbi:MAG TPA: hypothetical protein VKN62_08610, partial [Pelovirga sp.]|nr:hypothetical protein [Pelovirga sp.]